jgi:hypothetical protein
MDKWEKVAQYTWRLDVEGGSLYRVVDDAGASVVFVPCDTSANIEDMALSLDRIMKAVEAQS